MAPRTRTAAKRPHIVAAVVPPGPSLLELAAAVEVFGIARPHLADPWYELRVCTDRSVETAAPIYGMHVHAPYGLEAAGDADTLIAMPWGGEHHPDGETMATPAVLDVFRAAYERGARL